jgi:hypothetical protein
VCFFYSITQWFLFSGGFFLPEKGKLPSAQRRIAFGFIVEQ